jgi:PA domain
MAAGFVSYARERALTLLMALGLVAATLAISAPAMGASAPLCAVSNTRTHEGHSSLQAAVDAAEAGDTLEVKGTCVGNTTVGKDLGIKGVTNKTFPGPPTLGGGGTGTVLQIANGTTTTIDGLTISDGASLLNGVFQVGPTAIDYVSIGGSILPPTSGTEDYVFVGRACNGDKLLKKPRGKVALIIRGACFFSDKGANVAAAGATAAVIFNNQPGAFPQAVQLVNPVSIPVVGISNAAGTAMGASGQLTWTNATSFPQGCRGGGICNSGTLALVNALVSGNLGTHGGGVRNEGTLTLAGSTTITGNRGTFGGGINSTAGSVQAADGTSTYTDPITGATLPAWTGSVSENFLLNCDPTITLGTGTCGP